MTMTEIIMPAENDDDSFRTMSTEELIQNGHIDEENLISYIEKIRKEVQRAADDWLHIAYYVYELNYFGYYKARYDNIVECCQANFGFKKSTTYNFINIVEQFSVKKSFTLCQGMIRCKSKPQYVGFVDFFDAVKKWSYSQLVAMLSLSDKQREQVNPAMSAREIKKLKTDSKRLENVEFVSSDSDPATSESKIATSKSSSSAPAPGKDSYFDYTVSVLNAEIADYRKKYEAECDSNRQINCKLADMTAERDKALQDIVALNDQLKKVRSENRKLKADIKSLRTGS